MTQGNGGISGRVGCRSTGTPNNRLHTDPALRASWTGGSELAWFPSCSWFQADRRAGQVKQDVRHSDTNRLRGCNVQY